MEHMITCIVHHVPIDFQDFGVYQRYSDTRIDERSWLLPIVSEEARKILKLDFNCTWLVVGIGGYLGDKEVEMAKKDYPHCKFFGIEAESTSFGNFSKYGTVIPSAVGEWGNEGKSVFFVGLEDGEAMTNVIKNTWDWATEKRPIRAMHKVRKR